MTKSGPRGYYIYSPVGRTASKRLRDLLVDNTSYPFLAHIGAFHTEGKIPKNPRGIIHSHVLHAPIPQGFLPILSTRKDKSQIVMSNYIAQKAQEYAPALKKPPLDPFSIPVNEFMGMMYQIKLKEKKFIEKHNPVIIYLEDSVSDIERKLDVTLIDKTADTATISNYSTIQTIENYSELLYAYLDAFPDAQSDA